ncbi:MAG: DNA alkylation repair protein [Kofleriaceae bacterium]
MSFEARLERALSAKGTPKRAEDDKRYLKSALVHFGVQVPLVRATLDVELAEVPELDRVELRRLVEALWARGIHELRVAAIELLRTHVERLDARDVPLIERLLRASKTWAYVDGLAPHVMGPLVVPLPALTATLDRWATDEDFWLRRAALLALLVPLRAGGGDFERFGRYADAMLEEPEFFIRKAIGWILRDTSRRRPDLVFAWIAPRAHRASGVTLHEVVKHLSPAQRNQLAATRSLRGE